jgi:hypothetical protein
VDIAHALAKRGTSTQPSTTLYFGKSCNSDGDFLKKDCKLIFCARRGVGKSASSWSLQGSRRMVRVRGSPCFRTCLRSQLPDLTPETDQTDKGRHGNTTCEIENFYVEALVHAALVQMFESIVGLIVSCFDRADAKWPS